VESRLLFVLDVPPQPGEIIDRVARLPWKIEQMRCFIFVFGVSSLLDSVLFCWNPSTRFYEHSRQKKYLTPAKSHLPCGKG